MHTRLCVSVTDFQLFCLSVFFHKLLVCFHKFLLSFVLVSHYVLVVMDIHLIITGVLLLVSSFSLYLNSSISPFSCWLLFIGFHLAIYFFLFTLDQTVPPSTNSTDATVKYLKNINVFLHCIICVLGVAGNGMVIYIAGFKMKRTVNTIWFLNLAVADFLFSFFLIFTIIYEYRDSDWPFGDFMCKLSSLVTVLNMFASTFLLTAISLDRCLSTWVVVWARTKRTVLKARIICLFIWLAAVACTLPVVIFRKTHSDSPQQTLCIPGFSSLEAYKRVLVFRFVVGFLIPFIIILAAYVAIGVRVKRLRKDNKLKPFRIILAVILAFFFCWLPFYVYKFLEVRLYEMYDTDTSDELTSFQNVFDQIGLFIVSLAYLNSCLNPFLYMFMCEDFQKKLKHSLVMVFESAFAEEHLALLSQHSQSQRKSHSQSGTGLSLTQSLTLEG